MKFLRFLAVFVLAFSLVSPAAAMTGNSGQPAHYLALGDSLAAGMIQDASIGMGYADYLAQMLEEEELLASYNKGFAFPGYKTTDILEELEKNIKKPSSTTGERVALVDEIEKADVITLSVGANDILGHLQRGADGQISYDLLEISGAISIVSENLNTILEEIAIINPEADVFVMGYYNPFPYVTDYEAQFKQLVTIMDSTVKKIVESNQMFFVEVVDVLAADVESYLPNPANIHPSEVGYEAIAQAFKGPVLEYVSLVPLPEIIEPIFSDVEGWAVDYVEIAAELGLVNGYEDGTFRPNNTLSRAQMAAILARSMELTPTGTTPFTDIAGYNTQTQQEITAVYEAGIIKGDGVFFKPSNKLTRVQAARMLYRTYTYLMEEEYTPTAKAPFTDISKYSAEDQRAMTMLYELEIAQGDQGRYNPAGAITRAHAAKMMVNFYAAMFDKFDVPIEE